jgi:hypothetical protein
LKIPVVLVYVVPLPFKVNVNPLVPLVTLIVPVETLHVGSVTDAVGALGTTFTVTTVELEVALHPLSVTVTLYDPDVLTVILCVVAFVLHV